MAPTPPSLRRRYGVEAGLGLVVLVLAVTWLVREDAGRAPRAVNDAPASHETRSTATGAVLEGTRVDALAPQATTEPRTPSASSIASPASPAPASSARFTIEVMDEAGAAVPYASVALFSSRADMPETRIVDGATADADGRAEFVVAKLEELRATAGTTYPLAFHATLVPTLEDTPRVALPEALASARVRLVVPEAYLRRGRPLRVRVEDSAGRPLGGVQVQLLARDAVDPEFEDPCAQVESHVDGVATLALDEYRERRGSRSSGDRWIHRLQAWAPFEPLAAVDLGDELPAELVHLQLPPCGSVRVSVTGTERERVREPIVELRAPALVGQAQPQYLHVPVVDGHALFPAVGLGLALELQTRARNFRPSGTLVASGPGVPGERVELALELGTEWPRIALRLEDEHGQPFTGEFVAWIDGPPVQPQLGPLPRCDANGALEFHLPGDPEPGERRALVLRDAEFRTVRVPLHEPLPAAGVTDLGRFSFAPLARPPAAAPPEFLLAGRTVDAAGRAIGLASLVLIAPEDTGYTRNATSDAEGRFRIEGPPPKGAVQLWAKATGFRGVGPVEVRLGAEDVLVTLAIGATFEATVLWDDDLPAEQVLKLALIGPGGTLFLTPAPHVEVNDLLPATYALEVRDAVHFERRPLLHIEDIVLLAGRNPPAAPLAPLDLRRRFALVRAHLEGRDGQPIDGAVTVRIDGEKEEWSTDGQGTLRGVVLAGRALELEPQGYIPLRITPADFEQVLTFMARDAR